MLLKKYVTYAFSNKNGTTIISIVGIPYGYVWHMKFKSLVAIIAPVVY